MPHGQMDWNQCAAEVEVVAAQVRAAGYTPDIIIGIVRGGMVPSVRLHVCTSARLHVRACSFGRFLLVASKLHLHPGPSRSLAVSSEASMHCQHAYYTGVCCACAPYTLTACACYCDHVEPVYSPVPMPPSMPRHRLDCRTDQPIRDCCRLR